ncbi:MAG: malate synthase A, partial [Proteobacteria bacterium]|nr:malate synthase A [Pseudomonadota bacterium]
VQTCHKRGAFAMGGMAAFIPNRRDPEVTNAALARVKDDKERESRDGFDGTWVAHPDLIPTAMAAFDAVLGDRPNQIERQRPDVHVTAADLLALGQTPGQVTEAGVRGNVSVGLQYIAAWLGGSGAVAINNLMEDAATAEISRAQVWQWIHHGVTTAEGTLVTVEWVDGLVDEELAKIEASTGAAFGRFRWAEAAHIFREVALGETFPDFLTLPAYEILD